MYEAFYGFTRPPFSAVPTADDYFPAESIEQARQTLVRAIDRVEGVGVAIGAAGMGKTLLCQVLAQHFRRQMRVVLLANTQLSTRRSLLQSILFELKLPFRNLEEGEMRLAIMDHLEPTAASPQGMLLVLDEAHTIPLRLLEEIRLLSNLVRDGAPRVRLILAGNSRLEEHLAHPRLESFQQRIAARCYLESFHRQEVGRYVRQALDRVGADADALMTDDALTTIARLTDGVPRLVNQLGDHALLMGHGAQQRILDARLIEEAWSDLQQLPLPTTCSGVSVSPPRVQDSVELGGSLDQMDGVVEFGPLDESSDESLDSPSGLPSSDSLGSSDTLASSDTLVSSESRVSSESQFSSEKAEDPFGGPFASEEVVLDGNWTCWRAESLAQVSGSESHEFKAALAILTPARSTPSQGSEPEQGEYHPEESPAAEERVESLGCSEAPLPEAMPRPLQPERFGVTVSVERPIGLWDPASQPVDDRDIILVDEDDELEPDGSKNAARPRASRQEYRRLFGRLRQPA